MTKLSHRTLVAAAAVAALAAPVAAQAKGGHNQQNREARGHGHAHGPKFRNVIVRGTVAAVDGNVVTIAPRGGNHAGRGLGAQQLSVDVTNARVKVHDTNGDGKRDVSDVKVDDRVLAQFRVKRGEAPDLSTPFEARRLVDVGPAPSPDSDDDQDAEQPTTTE